MTMMDNSPRVERFTTVTTGDVSATLLYAYHTNGVLVNTTTMWNPDIYRSHGVKIKVDCVTQTAFAHTL